MLRHYVFLKFREETSDAHIAAFSDRMRALREGIDGIQYLEIGRDELHDSRSWDMVLIMAFASAEELRGYQRHPRHLEVMAFNAPFVADVATVDFTQPE